MNARYLHRFQNEILIRFIYLKWDCSFLLQNKPRAILFSLTLQRPPQQASSSEFFMTPPHYFLPGESNDPSVPTSPETYGRIIVLDSNQEGMPAVRVHGKDDLILVDDMEGLIQDLVSKLPGATKNEPSLCPCQDRKNASDSKSKNKNLLRTMASCLNDVALQQDHRFSDTDDGDDEGAGTCASTGYRNRRNAVARIPQVRHNGIKRQYRRSSDSKGSVDKTLRPVRKRRREAKDWKPCSERHTYNKPTFRMALSKSRKVAAELTRVIYNEADWKKVATFERLAVTYDSGQYSQERKFAPVVYRFPSGLCRPGS